MMQMCNLLATAMFVVLTHLEPEKPQQTSAWLVIIWTLSHISTISFCINLHSISTCVHMTCNFVLCLQNSLLTV